MTQITAVNSTDQSAQLSISRGGGEKTQALSGRIPVAADAVVIVPPIKAYTVNASAVLGGETYTTSTLRLPDAGWRLIVRLEHIGDVFDFQLVSEPGEAPELMTLLNTVDAPALFTINAHAADEPGEVILSSELVVQPRDRLEVGTANTYAFYAIVDGLVTNTVKVDPGRPGQDVTVQIVDQPGDSGMADYALVLVEPAAEDD